MKLNRIMLGGDGRRFSWSARRPSRRLQPRGRRQIKAATAEADRRRAAGDSLDTEGMTQNASTVADVGVESYAHGGGSHGGGSHAGAYSPRRRPRTADTGPASGHGGYEARRLRPRLRLQPRWLGRLAQALSPLGRRALRRRALGRRPLLRLVQRPLLLLRPRLVVIASRYPRAGRALRPPCLALASDAGNPSVAGSPPPTEAHWIREPGLTGGFADGTAAEPDAAGATGGRSFAESKWRVKSRVLSPSLISTSCPSDSW